MAFAVVVVMVGAFIVAAAESSAFAAFVVLGETS